MPRLFSTRRSTAPCITVMWIAERTGEIGDPWGGGVVAPWASPPGTHYCFAVPPKAVGSANEVLIDPHVSHLSQETPSGHAWGSRRYVHKDMADYLPLFHASWARVIAPELPTLHQY